MSASVPQRRIPRTGPAPNSGAMHRSPSRGASQDNPALRRPKPSPKMLHVRTSLTALGRRQSRDDTAPTGRRYSPSNLSPTTDRRHRTQALACVPAGTRRCKDAFGLVGERLELRTLQPFCDRAFDVHGLELVVVSDPLDRRLPGHFRRVAAACGALRRRSGETVPRRRGRAVRGRQSSDAECLITNGPAVGTGPRGPCSALGQRIRQPAFVRVFVEYAVSSRPRLCWNDPPRRALRRSRP
jgi:hypothetical protein